MPRLNKEAILSGLDFRDFLGRELHGRIANRSGSNWQAHSPFREDKDPSLSFNVDTGLWNDFGGDSGDVFKFVMLLHGLSFRDALKYLEQYLGGNESVSPMPLPFRPAFVPPSSREYPPVEFRFFELVEGPPSNRKSGRMVEISDRCTSGLLLDRFGDLAKAAYASALLYSLEAVQYRDNPETGGGKGSLSDYPGPVKISLAYFDFDCKENSGKALRDVSILLERLRDFGIPQENLLVFFSGSKGFHVLLSDPGLSEFPGSGNANKIAENFCKDLAGDLPTFDPKVYLKTQLFRVINSRHPDTGLFKIPLNLDEVDPANIEEIRELAREPRQLIHKNDGEVGVAV